MRFQPAVLAFALIPVAASAAEDPTISTFTLANGLMGVVIEDHRAPVVTQTIYYRVGSADEPPGQSGIAHFLEHLMFKATDMLADGDFSRIVAENGGDDNAYTTEDHTAYYQRIAADRLDLVMSMEADRMTGLNPGAEGVLSERDVVREERRQRLENEPDGAFNEQKRAILYLNHPYGHPVIGWPDEIEAFTLDKAMAFYRTHYAPNNAILVVAGDVDPAEVERLAEANFGKIPASDLVPPRLRPQEPTPVAARSIEMSDPRIRQPILSRTYLAPQRKPGDQREAAALAMLAQLLASGINSVMSRELELGDGAIALDSGAWYDDVGVDPQSFSFYLAPKPGISRADSEAALDALIAGFIAEGPDLAQLERVKTRLRASEIYARDSAPGRAGRLGAALASGLTIEDHAAWPDLLQAVTPDEIVAAATAVLRPEASVTGWLSGVPAGTEVVQ